MITSPSSLFGPLLTIESVHGFKETVVVGPGGVSPVTSQSPEGVGGSDETGGGQRPRGEQLDGHLRGRRDDS